GVLHRRRAASARKVSPGRYARGIDIFGGAPMTETTAGPVHGGSFEYLAAFLRRVDPDGWPVDEVRECVCRSCDGRRFRVRVMDTASAARRTCLDCGRHELIADSVEYWDDDPEVQCPCACLCGREDFAGAVGYSL